MSGASRELSAVDLFCGAGGFSLGLQQSGIKVVGALDHWAPAAATYRANFSHPILQEDAGRITPEELRRELDIPSSGIDIVVGGPPCQGFSIQRIGPDFDNRNDLIERFAAFIAELRPRLFILENVPGLLGRRGMPFVGRFLATVTNEGYRTKVTRVQSADYGVPQLRRRVFVFGWLPGTPVFVMPPAQRSASNYRTVWEAIGDLPEPPADHSPHPADPLHRRMKLSARNRERLRLIPQGGGFEDLPSAMRVNAHRNGAARIGHRAVYGRLTADKPAGTITARFDSFTRGRFAHPYEDRNITLREGARLQTFPDTFQFFGSQEEIAAQIGNAVPPLLAHVIGEAVVDQLFGTRDQPSVAAVGATGQLDVFGA